MSVTASDIILYQAELRPANDTDPVGGKDGTTEITDTTIGEFLPHFRANAAGGADRIQYQKCCLKCDHTSDTFYDPVVWLPYSIDDLTAAGVLKFQFDDTADATNSSLYIIGQDASGDPQTETLAIGGVDTLVSGSKTWNSGAGGVLEVMVKATDTGALKDLADGDVIIYDDATNEIGKIFDGNHSAHGNLYLWLEGTINADTTSDNRLTAPGGASWGKPRKVADAFACADDIDAGEYQGMWLKQILYAGMSNISDGDLRIAFYGADE